MFHHVVTTQADLYGRMSFGSPIDLGLSSTYTYDELRTGWVQVRQIVQRTLDKPVEASLRYDGYFGATSFEETVDRFYSFDLVVHSWDIAVATHLHAYESIDAVEMANCLADFADLSATMRQPGLLGPELPVAANADEQTRFLAFLGRTAP